MMELDKIHRGTDWRYQIDTDFDSHEDKTTFNLGTTEAKVAMTGTPDVSTTITWGAFVAGHTIGAFALSKEETAALTPGLYYFQIFSVGTDTTPLGDGVVQVML
jgi:hypothetical protein